MQNYFNSTEKKEADKSEAITNRIHNTFTEQFSSKGCFEVHFLCM